MAENNEQNFASPTKTEYTITYQPQEETSSYFHKTPVLPKTHCVIIYSPEDDVFEPDRKMNTGTLLGGSLQSKESMKGEPFKVKYHDLTVPMSDKDFATDIRSCLKIVIIFSKNLLICDKRLQDEWKIIEETTSERHIECVIPVFHGLRPEDLPLLYRESSVMPAELQTGEFINTNGPFYRPVVKQLSESVVIGAGDFSGVGSTLAWGHFFGWLFLVLQGLNDRVVQTAEASSGDWDVPTPFELIPKMIAVIPRRGYHANRRSLSDYDPKIKILKTKGDQPVKAKYTMDMQGHPDKDYSNPLHYMTVDGKTYVFVAEVPTTLKTLTELQNSGFTNKFEKDEHERELHRFRAQLQRIMTTVPKKKVLKTPENVTGENRGDGDKKEEYITVVDEEERLEHEKRRQALSAVYYDEDNAHELPLSRMIAETIQKELTFQKVPWRE